ncbi:MAG: MerR family transcriptional regulator [Alphaproteobacteria bacterium 16-39-46]|nr:MAG: MerR family transcriptional regulator [Alphaproteobacteria bacterium 16-39-46]OZA43745.1 MAG: MerR family transcriptional regulator [Alphaproteobacteria bacterium 17-39-52]HQS83562.1 MerR family transcriptional regulator [Alphaproteobacteria bacterium]HQS93339.1 MerR family transcriptional regulator [Alphaproteobacteria bacterium]
MTKWYVKDLSKLTGVSVQTLHHYDRIDLLKPSLRLTNGYRLYSEKDLLKLQQIIALKFFGFDLSQIKILLTGNIDMNSQFSVQAKFLEEKAQTLLEASKTLKSLVSECHSNKSIPWETILKLIEVYKMTEKLEHSWVKEIFTPDELKQYVAFQTELKSKSTPEQKSNFEKSWSNLKAELQDHLETDPKSEVGIALGKKFMLFINELYGKKYAHLRTKKWEKGFGEGKGLEEIGLTPKNISWLEKAIDAYWRDRIYAIFDQVGKTSPSAILTLWNDVLDDMYGEDTERKKALCDIALQDDKISKEAKQWLQSLPT